MLCIYCIQVARWLLITYRRCARGSHVERGSRLVYSACGIPLAHPTPILLVNFSVVAVRVPFVRFAIALYRQSLNSRVRRPVCVFAA